MKTKLHILTFFILLSGVAFGQSIRDSVFNNVILIKNTDVATNGFHFLIDIPIKAQKDPIVIFNDDYRIPKQLFFNRNSFLWEQNEIILIESANLRNPTKETEKVAPSIILYHIQRENSKVDSLQIVWISTCPIKINYRSPKLNENEVKYFFKECYGSTCCPEDEN